nr:hypothetical protein Iba_chr07cCG4090 [Ipomoea batatas]GMD28689.1 hypothetical protein Iba_chr08eCG9690 [Ipomoea batatas]GMD78743.1 hypothetical protein Iba_scaffold328162CG0030 [Ipomoea batatas]
MEPHFRLRDSQTTRTQTSHIQCVAVFSSIRFLVNTCLKSRRGGWMVCCMLG